MPFSKSGSPYYWCPYCRRGHCRDSTIGRLHKVYVDISIAAKLAEAG